MSQALPTDPQGAASSQGRREAAQSPGCHLTPAKTAGLRVEPTCGREDRDTLGLLRPPLHPAPPPLGPPCRTPWNFLMITQHSFCEGVFCYLLAKKNPSNTASQHLFVTTRLESLIWKIPCSSNSLHFQLSKKPSEMNVHKPLLC